MAEHSHVAIECVAVVGSVGGYICIAPQKRTPPFYFVLSKYVGVCYLQAMRPHVLYRLFVLP